MTRYVLWLFILALAIAHNANLFAQQLSVAVTSGGSIRLLQVDKNGSPTLRDNAAGDPAWTQAPNPIATALPQDSRVLALPNAEVRVYAFDQDGLIEFRATRSQDAWTSVPIDPRSGAGQPCAIRTATDTYVFGTGRNGQLIAKRQVNSQWTTLSTVESSLGSATVSSLNCSSSQNSASPITLVATTQNGLRLITFGTAGDRVSVTPLKDALGQSVSLSGRPAISFSSTHDDVLGLTANGTLMHWTRALGSANWQFESQAAGFVGPLSAASFQSHLFAAGRSGNGQISILERTASGTWETTTWNSPSGDTFATDPVLASQPDRLSAFALLASGKLTALQNVGPSWNSETVVPAVQPFQPKLLTAVAGATQTLNDFIDGIPLLIPPAAQPPTVTDTQTTYTTVQGVRFENLTYTNVHSANLAEVITSDPNGDVIWPGSVIQGQTIASGSLAAVGLPRAPLSITIVGAAGNGPLSTTIQTPTLATVATGIRDLLKNLNLVQATAAADFDSSTGNTEEDALLNLGVGANFLGQSVKASVQSSSTQKSTTLAYKFVQRYYSLDVDTPASPASLFAPSVTSSDAQRFMGAGNPPAYMSQVTYGRMLVYLFESSASIDTLKETLDAVFNVAKVSGQVHLDAEQQQILNTAHIHMFALGGSAVDVMNLIAASDFASQLNTYLNQGANFSFDSPGAPLSYTVKFLKDGTVAQINSATQWQSTASYALPEQGSFTVSLGRNSNGITHTGFVIRPGDLVSLNATGWIWSGVFLTGLNQPNGWYTWQKPSGRNFPNMSVSPFCLLYNVGNSGAPPPYAGFGFTSRPINDSGELELIINTNNPGGGSGHFNVDVRVDRLN